MSSPSQVSLHATLRSQHAELDFHQGIVPNKLAATGANYEHARSLIGDVTHHMASARRIYLSFITTEFQHLVFPKQNQKTNMLVPPSARCQARLTAQKVSGDVTHHMASARRIYLSFIMTRLPSPLACTCPSQPPRNSYCVCDTPSRLALLISK